MQSCQLAPLRGELEFVIRRCGVFERMVNAVVIKKHPEHFMSLRQGDFDKLIRGVPGIGLVRTGVDLYREFHLDLSLEELQQAGQGMLPRPNVLRWLDAVTLPRHHKNITLVPKLQAWEPR